MKLSSRYSLRILWSVLGMALLVWLSIENQNPRSVLFFSLLVCILGAFSLCLRWNLYNRPRPYSIILLCTVAGLVVVPVGLLMMALKTGLHAHPAPDFTYEQISWIVSRAPFWGLVGLLAGCSAFFWRTVRK